MRYSTKAVLGFDIFCVREVVIVKESDDESEGEEELDGAGEAWRGMEVTSSEEINPCVTGEWEAASAAAAADRVTLVASMKGDVAAVLFWVRSTVYGQVGFYLLIRLLRGSVRLGVIGGGQGRSDS